ncbi:N-acetyltransferase family protein [Roseateles sp. P5_E8]
MTIRFATLNDVPALVEGGRRMHALTRFRSFDYDEQKVASAFTDLLTKGQQKYVFLVAQNSASAVVGALIGVLEQHIFSDQLTASVMHYDVLPEARSGGHGVRLLKAFEQWAANRKVAEIGLGINSGVDLARLSRFAVRMGYQKIGENFVKSSR